MKNLVKALGIIAVIAVIGLAVGCETAPEDQVEIVISGIDAGADGYNVYFALTESITDDESDPIAMSDSNNKISGGKVSALMVDEKLEAFGKEGTYYIIVFVNKDPLTASNFNEAEYSFLTPSKKSIAKGSNTFAAGDFKIPETSTTLADNFIGSAPVTPPDAEEDFENKYAGKYKATYTLNSGDTQDEYVDFGKDYFNIYQKNGSGDKSTNFFLDFTITKWEFVETIPDGYVKGFKFTGKIKGGKPDTNFIFGAVTAPNFNASDINITEAWMFVYFKEDKTFKRTAFSKDGSDQSKTIIENRTYSKLPQ